MAHASSTHQYELAAQARDRLRDIERVTESQKIITPHRESFDVINYAQHRQWAAVALFRIREGKLMGQVNFFVKHPEGTEGDFVLASFLEQYYASAADRPKVVYLPTALARGEGSPNLLGLRFTVPLRGKKRQLLALGAKNAAAYLERQEAERLLDANRARRALEGLQKSLRLKHQPRRIEVFDISNIQGAFAVGSMVVAEDGLARPDQYRKFSVRTRTKPDDPAMMAEVVRRRLQHREWKTPDLIILDGGKGQLSVVLRAVRDIARTTPFVALAKREEELFLPGRAIPVRLAQNTDALFLVQRMRDEAHRFAITFYRSRHRQATTESGLDAVPGVGPKTKRTLLRTFGTLQQIRAASERELAAAVGKKKAHVIKQELS